MSSLEITAHLLSVGLVKENHREKSTSPPQNQIMVALWPADQMGGKLLLAIKLGLVGIEPTAPTAAL